MTVGPNEVKAKWIRQCDLSVGCTYKALSVVGVIYNLFNDPVSYDTFRDDYLKSEPIYRVNASYTLKF